MKKNYLKKSTLVVAIISQLFLCSSVRVFATSFGTNLVFNGDAELGTTAGWTATGNVNAFVVADAYFGEDAQTVHGKVLELYDGSPNVEATFSQIIDISDIHSMFSARAVALNFSAQAYSWYGATASYKIEELDAANNIVNQQNTGNINLFGQSVNYHVNDESACTWTTTTLRIARLDTRTSKLRISVYGKTSNLPEDFVDFDNIQVVLSVTPTVGTEQVTSFTTNSATFGGTVTAENGSAVIERGFAYSTTNATPTIGGAGVTSIHQSTGGSGAGPFSMPATGLSSSTVYYVCAFAINSAGTGYGAVVSFMTQTVAPTVATTTVTNITATTATLTGTCNPNNAPATGWFRYSSTSPGAINDSFGARVPSSGGVSIGNGTSPVTYTKELTGLIPGVTYYYGAIASNAGGTGFGTIMTFTTQAIPAITWSNPADITYGTLLSATQLNATANVPGTFTYTPALGTKLDAGTVQNLKVDFTPDDAVKYSAASKTVTINVAKATPVIAWENPANITYGTELSATQLNATADVPGTFTYTPAIGVKLDAGNSQVLKSDFVPIDQNNYEAATKTVLINVLLSTGKTEFGHNEFIVVYPNPVIDAFDITGIDGKATISLTDLNGRTILTKEISADEKVTVSNLTSGLYLIRITTGKGAVLKKMVKK